MNDFERTLVKSFNESFEEAGLTALAYRLKQSRFAPQFIDVIVDSGNPSLYMGIECKSISVDKGASALYFKQHFTTDKKGVHQVERISEFLRQTGRKGFLAVEFRMGAGHSKQAYLIPWDVVENDFREKAVKIPIEQIKTHSELQRRGKIYGLSSLFEPLRKTRMDTLKKQ
jgi:Holliday junction resolvase